MRLNTRCSLQKARDHRVLGPARWASIQPERKPKTNQMESSLTLLAPGGRVESTQRFLKQQLLKTPPENSNVNSSFLMGLM